MGIKGAGGAALGKFFQALRDAAIDNRFGFKDNHAIFRPRLKDVAHRDPNLLANPVRDDDLIFVFDGNDGHSRVCNS